MKLILISNCVKLESDLRIYAGEKFLNIVNILIIINCLKGTELGQLIRYATIQMEGQLKFRLQAL